MTIDNKSPGRLRLTNHKLVPFIWIEKLAKGSDNDIIGILVIDANGDASTGANGKPHYRSPR